VFDGAHLYVRRPEAEPQRCAYRGPGTYPIGGVEIEVRLSGDGTRASLAWAVANGSAGPIALDAVGLEWWAPCGGTVRFFANGYQSWSPTGARVLGAADDPSRHPRSFRFIRAVHHSDPGVAAEGELRSELVTVIDFDRGDGVTCIGFDGGDTHGGTIRARRADNGEDRDGRVELRAEAWLGGAILPPGARRALHTVRVTNGDDAPALLDEWAAHVGRVQHARPGPPYLAGWCSWYFYFHDVTERAVTENLARAADWPFTLFQLDDGFQHAIGDWLRTTDAFPSGVDGIAAAIAARDLTPGLWLAPFLAAPDSDLAAARPELFARDLAKDEPLVGMYHEKWGGFMHQLDTTRDDVREHLAATARSLVDMGYRYLKLDFTFSPAVPGRFADPTRTPAERVRAGYDAVRAGAGDDAVLLGCGCPLGAVIGAVDAMRIGPDVAPWWDVTEESHPLAGYDAAAPSTRNAWTSTLARSFMHRRLWANDPDCVMLRTTHTDLTADAARAWAYAVGVSGGFALVSDDLALLDTDARGLFDEVLAIGRDADREACDGEAPRCDDVLVPGGPSRLRAAGRELRADPTNPVPVLRTVD
jgi:alpha-galactosidase